MKRSIACLGLGVMGGPMAGHLAQAGHDVRAWNRGAERGAAWATKHGRPVMQTIAQAVQDANFIVICVGRDEDVRAVMAQVLPVVKPGAVVIDHSTTTDNMARDMAADAKAASAFFLDAPVSGGQAGAEAGRLSVMVGGDAAAFETAKAVMAAYAAAITHMGESGAGQLTKMVNQIAIAGLVEALAEAQNFAKRAGLDPALVLQAIAAGAARSWQMENRWPTMAEGRFDFGFAVDWMRKDLGYCMATADRLGADVPVTRLVDGYYAEVQALGGGRWDTSSLIARFDKKNR